MGTDRQMPGRHPAPKLPAKLRRHHPRVGEETQILLTHPHSSQSPKAQQRGTAAPLGVAAAESGNPEQRLSLGHSPGLPEPHFPTVSWDGGALSLHHHPVVGTGAAP